MPQEIKISGGGAEKGHKPLPMFREDLILHPGPTDPDGCPTYNVQDPLTGQYFKITWAEAHVMQAMRPGMTAEDIVKKLAKTTTLRLTPDEVEQFFTQAAQLKLLNVYRPSEQVYEEAEKGKTDWVKWLMLHYLYFRVPLVRPDKFLARTLPLVMPLVSPVAVFAYIFLTLIGLIMLTGQFTEYLHTFTYFFNLEGIITYAITITIVKIIHEFAHAYTAKYYGIHVPTMGIAFLVLWPVLYTDVTDSWKLKDRRERLAISTAGMAAEFTIAGLCTLGWVLSTPGLLQSAFFLVSSITWITSLFININPALRFDGYYILSDLWGIDNLQQRAFAVTRWRFRQWFLGMVLPCPEERLSKKNERRMILYAVFTFIYRLFLYTAIAIFVYYAFTKALGVFLFILEILLFFIWPVAWEISDLYAQRQHFHWNRRFTTTSAVFVAIALWFILPLPHMQTFPAISVPAVEQRIYMPFPGIVDQIYIQREEAVKAGDPILKLSSRPIETQVEILNLDKQISEAEIHILQNDEKNKPYLKEKLSELAAKNEKLIGFMARQEKSLILSSIDGKVYYLDAHVIPGQFVQENQMIGIIAKKDPMNVVGFIPELNTHVVHLDQEVYFRVKRPFERYKGKIVDIQSLRSNILIYPPLASIYGGDLPTHEPVKGTIKLVESYYTVRIELEGDDRDLRFDQVGLIEVEGPWESKASHLWKRLLNIIWRESGI